MNGDVGTPGEGGKTWKGGLCFHIMPERNGRRWSVRFLSEPISPSINPRVPCASTQIRKYEKGERHIFCQFSLILMTVRPSHFSLSKIIVFYYIQRGPGRKNWNFTFAAGGRRSHSGSSPGIRLRRWVQSPREPKN